MGKLKEQIYINRWLDLKPYDSPCSTDGYYLELCNLVKKTMITNKQSFMLQNHLDKDEIDVMACFLTSYFEDLISGTRIWDTFIKVHKRSYKKVLPFYEIDEYYEQEINLPDIYFLIWYFMNTVQQDKFISPFMEYIIEISETVMDVFENAWEYAPENEYLKAFYSIDEKETDFYLARNLIDNVLFKSYLFYPDTLLDLRDGEMEMIEESKNDENLINFLNDNRDHKLYNTYTRLLGLKGQEWVAEILGDGHSLSKHYRKISKKISGYFFYKGQDEEDVFLEHIASGKQFKLTKKSFGHYGGLKDIDTILFMGIAEWRNEWWFSGVYFQSDFNPDLVLDEKNSVKSRSVVNFLDYQKKDMDEILNEQLKAFKMFNNKQQIAFMQSDEIEFFTGNFIETFNASLNLSQKEKEEAKQRARNDGFLGSEHEKKDFSRVSESGLVFFNPKSGVEIALAVNSAFPIKNNPYFNESESEEHIIRLFFTEGLSTELTMYCIDNFKHELKFFETVEGKMYLDNIDFLLRFWKRGNYHTKPSITFTGVDH
ncbi:DUF3843 family protein [Carboxylicivirga sp. N1Y90]|uniref:DUF3843 family protein n=1 Tax=Carboxylicivirga fragile TaxID=3417571 RepID=UPI003D3538C7|nr:DUF3843 family protein [Marinilabiliaceae bacterium N1Y90]